MAKTVEELLQENNEMLRGVLTGMKGQQSTGSASGGAPSMQWLNNISTFSNSATTALGKLTQGTYSANDGILNFKEVMGAIGPVGKVTGDMLGGVTEAAMKVNSSLNTVSQSGVYMGNNLGLYDKAVLQARMSLPEFEAQIQKSSTSIAALGPNADKGALAYLNTAKKIQETDAAGALQATGMKSEEFGKILTMVAMNSKMQDLNRTTVQQNMIASVVQLAVEMDNTARLTGISRQQQQENIEAIQKTTQMQLYKLALDEKSAKAVDMSVTQTQKYGQAVSEAVSIYAMGGPMNDKETETIVALGPEMADAARRLSEIRGDTKADEEKRKAIIAEMDAISARKAQDKEQIEQMQRLYRTGDSQSKAMAEAYLKQASVGAQYTKQMEEAREKGMTLEQYRAAEAKKIADERESALKAKPGPEGDATMVATTINRAERVTKDAMAGAGKYFNELNTEVGGSIKNFNLLNNVLRPMTAEYAASIPKQMVSGIKEKAGVKDVTVPETEKKPKLWDGTMGTFGSLIHDFGKETTVDLHGKEAVLNEGQLKNLLGSMQGGLKGDLEKAKAMMPTTATFEKMFGQMTMPDTVKTPTTQPPMDLFPGANGGDATNNDLSTGVKQLNTLMERLIKAVEDGHENSIKAIKSNGNLIA